MINLKNQHNAAPAAERSMEVRAGEPDGIAQWSQYPDGEQLKSNPNPKKNKP